MQLSKLDLPKEFLDKMDVDKLNPVQEDAVCKGLLKGKNMVIASPTASGKTLIAEMAAIKHFSNHGKIVYLCPLKALASEKYNDFKKKYSSLGLKVAISTGDYDSGGAWLDKYDIVVCTNEKMDSMIRHGTSWVSKISLVIVDEIHLLNDHGRGPIIEFVLTQLTRMTNAQILALSATISNADEIAKWLNARLVKSDYRPVKLYKGVSYQSDTGDKVEHTIEFLEKDLKKVYGKLGEEALVKDVLEMQKQSLVFLATRRSTESTGEKLSKITNQYLKAGERKELEKISNEIESVLPNPTKQCKKLSSMVKRGTAFHHAGLLQKQRDLVEDGFKKGFIKVLASTVTLAYGVNIPAYRVVIRDFKRFSGYGSDYMPVLDIHQMQGRAGRPAYDTEGEAVIVCHTDGEAEEIKYRYLLSETEPIESKLDSEPMIRIYTLALISSGLVKSKGDLIDFFKKTFYAHQNSIDNVDKSLDKVLKQLENYGFIQKIDGLIDEKTKKKYDLDEFVPAFDYSKDFDIKSTKIGKRVSELYIDPQSAWEMIKNMKNLDNMEYFMIINKCNEMQPLLRVKKDEYDDLGMEMDGIISKIDVPGVWDIEYQEFIRSFKTALLFNEWIDERTEDHVLEKFSIPPGELYNKIRGSEWMIYAYRELARALDNKEVANNLNKLLLRIKHGVREDLLKLVMIKGIGRVRARKLWRSKIRTPADIKKVRIEILQEILGPKLAEKVKKEMK